MLVGRALKTFLSISSNASQIRISHSCLSSPKNSSNLFINLFIWETRLGEDRIPGQGQILIHIITENRHRHASGPVHHQNSDSITFIRSHFLRYFNTLLKVCFLLFQIEFTARLEDNLKGFYRSVYQDKTSGKDE